MDSYLQIAFTVLEEERRPLSARDILRSAYVRDLVPSHLFGQTQHKTLHARLAEEILAKRQNSAFVRTSPGRFFLRKLQLDERLPEDYRYEFPAPVRADQLSNFDVLCFDKADLTPGVILFDHAEAHLPSLLAKSKYVHSKHVADDARLISANVFLIVSSGGQLLSNLSMKRALVGMSGKRSIGFSSKVRDTDNSLFDRLGNGVEEAAFRVLSHSISPPDALMLSFRTMSSLDVVGVIWLPSEVGYSDTLGLIVRVDLMQRYDPTLRFGPLSGLRWERDVDRVNDLEMFEPWSRVLIQNRIMSHTGISNIESFSP